MPSHFSLKTMMIVVLSYANQAGKFIVAASLAIDNTLHKWLPGVI
jgi:hypothetical protein